MKVQAANPSGLKVTLCPKESFHLKMMSKSEKSKICQFMHMIMPPNFKGRCLSSKQDRNTPLNGAHIVKSNKDAVGFFFSIFFHKIKSNE